ncbi:MAG: bifunctional DNA-binding transcriptional regulator/O6-methylguanine-DNA methyltransferase Ada [Stenomitos frigidus ULC029]
MQPTIAAPFSTEALRWNALLAGDRQAEGVFVYAVTTTGVYCRPGCASRLPKREHVRFFQTCSEAEQAGFRPCKRCQPNTVSPREAQVQLIAHLCKLIETSETAPSLSALAAVAGLSPYHLQRLFKAIVGVTPKTYAIAQRQQCLRDDLQKGGSVTQAIYNAGFSSSSQFYGKATSMLGMAPSQDNAGATNIAIQFAIEQSFLGLVLVAATDRGLCAIDFGDTPETLTERLQTRFPKAQLHAADPTFSSWVAQVLTLIETPDHGLNLPLDIQGTAFQQRVWQALQAIPLGTTMSYTEVAKQIDHPTAVRAVATACAANTLAVVIPCHRVVRSDGALSGYRWGIARKQALLEREASP